MNIILLIITLLLTYVGFVQFKEDKSAPNEVEHTEPDGNDTVNCTPLSHYALRGLGKWRRDLNKEQKLLYRQINK